MQTVLKQQELPRDKDRQLEELRDKDRQLEEKDKVLQSQINGIFTLVSPEKKRPRHDDSGEQ